MQFFWYNGKMRGGDIYTIENPSQKNGGEHTERRLETVSRQSDDNREKIVEARERLLDNEDLYRKYIRGFTSMEGNHPVELAGLQNIFITFCQDLPDPEIESLVTQFIRGLIDYILKNKATIGISQNQLEKILSPERRAINARGIINIVEFIRARKKLHGTLPGDGYGLYIEENLDARHKIDLVECIFGEDENGQREIDSMNLIQVKSQEPDEKQQEDIITDHRRWIRECVMDLETFEREFSKGIPDGIAIKTLLKNAEEMETLLLDLCTDPAGFNPDNFISRLDLEDLTNKQKAWLLLTYGSDLRKKIHDSVEQGLLEKEQGDAILATLEKLESKIRAKAKMPKRFATIQNINSVIAVGPRIVKQEEIASASIPGKNKKVLKLE